MILPVVIDIVAVPAVMKKKIIMMVLMRIMIQTRIAIVTTSVVVMATNKQKEYSLDNDKNENTPLSRT